MYTKSETMRIIGEQTFSRMADAVQSKGLQEIYTAHMERTPVLTCHALSDAYIYGFIMGQRAERAKRKAKAETK